MRCGRIAVGSIGGGKIFLVDADVKAGLLELLFNINLAFLHERQKIAAQPGDLGEGEAVFRDVDGLTGEVGRGCVALSRGCVAVDVHEMLLEFDGADSGVDLQRCVEVGVVCAGDGSKEFCSPGAAVTTVQGKPLVDLQGVCGRKRDQETFAAQCEEVFIVLNAVEPVTLGYLVLMYEDVVGPSERWRHDEAAAPVVEGWQDDRGCDLVFDTSQVRSFSGSGEGG